MIKKTNAAVDELPYGQNNRTGTLSLTPAVLLGIAAIGFAVIGLKEMYTFANLTDQALVLAARGVGLICCAVACALLACAVVLASISNHIALLAKGGDK